MPASETQYRGRFAPSPTGPLHLGSLIAALASYLDARHCGGVWLVRMEDLDPPREQPGAAESILNSLQQHGLHWDEEVLWQSKRQAAYNRALNSLKHEGLLFDCDCTRAELGPGGACDGRCLSKPDLSSPTAKRIAVARETVIEFEDRVLGAHREALGQSLPDFVLHRKDGLFAYQLAVVVDDLAQGISDIVRGSDLFDSTPRQLYLQHCLQPQSSPWHYCHLPVICNDDGQKFSKQNHAPALDPAQAAGNLRLALQFLQQTSPPASSNCSEILSWASQHWNVDAIPKQHCLPASELYRLTQLQ